MISFNWGKLGKAEADKAVAAINKHLSELNAKGSGFLRVQVESLEWGDKSPSVELRKICDPPQTVLDALGGSGKPGAFASDRNTMLVEVHVDFDSNGFVDVSCAFDLMGLVAVPLRLRVSLAVKGTMMFLLLGKTLRVCFREENAAALSIKSLTPKGQDPREQQNMLEAERYVSRIFRQFLNSKVFPNFLEIPLGGEQ